MAHFYGSTQGCRGAATRLGSKSSGLQTVAASWRGAVSVHLYTDEDGKDCALIRLRPWQGAGVDRVLYDGPVNAKED